MNIYLNGLFNSIFYRKSISENRLRLSAIEKKSYNKNKKGKS